eukprot:TRINITY_DN41711_c0_g1_i1.p1 TRINITY_DN41711_c0_g1~~TRINITY_DN41711_c0_g1_i1.p1  ORF type:complete len:142 (-),score=21.32 TRINITY_DN41711_c0_g1_i1:51-476(-)
MCPGFRATRWRGAFLEDEHAADEEHEYNFDEEVDGGATVAQASSSLPAIALAKDDPGSIPWRMMRNGTELILCLREIPDSLDFLDDDYSDDGSEDDSLLPSFFDDMEDSSLPSSFSDYSTMALLGRRRFPVSKAHRKLGFR